MAKLSQQILSKETPDRSTRTERVLIKRGREVEQQRQEQERINQKNANDKLSNATFENYGDVYDSIDAKYKKGVITPTELRKTADYIKWTEEKKKEVEIEKWRGSFSAYDSGRRGNPFVLGLDPSKEDVRKYNEVRKALHPNKNEVSVIPKYIVDALKKGMTKDFGVTPKVFGLDAGQKSRIVTKDTATGKIKEIEEYEKKAGKLYYGKLTSKDIEAQREKAYTDFLKEKPKVDIYKGDLNIKEKGITDDRRWYDKSIDELLVQPFKQKITKVSPHLKEGVVYGLGKAKQGIGIADKNIHFDLGEGSTSFPKIKVSFGKQETPTMIEQGIVEAQKDMMSKSSSILQAEITRQLGGKSYTAFKEGKELQGQEDIESLFYRSDVGKKAYMDATTEEEIQSAFKEYQESDEYKDYGQKYAKDYQKDLDNLISEVPYSKSKVVGGAYAGLKIAGLSFSSLGLSAIKTPTRAVLTAGAIYGGVSLLGKVPTVALTQTDIVFGTYGGAKLLAPSSSIEARGMGLLMVGASATSLGVKGISYARQPTVKAIKIKAPKINIKASQTKFYDLKGIDAQGKAINRAIYPHQKISQQGVAGRRTVVSTRVRGWLGLDPVYKGIPYGQKSTVFKSLRGTTVIKTQSDYQKAIDLLVKRGGYTTSQAQQTIRYVQPKVIEQYLSKGVVTIKGGKAVGEFTYLTKQPSLTIDSTLGIKTRGARTIKDVWRIERKIGTLKVGGKGTSVIRGNIYKSSFYLKGGSSPFDFKSMGLGKEILKGKVSGLKKGWDFTSSEKGIKVWKQINYRDLRATSFTKDVLPSGRVIRADSRAIAIEKMIDLQRKNMGFRMIGGKKTPLSKTFGVTDDIKDIIKVTKTSKQSSNINKIVNQIEKEFTSPAKTSSKYAGTGLYERSGSAGLQQNLQLQQLLKQPPAFQPAKVMKMDELLKVGQGSVAVSKTAMSLKVLQGLGLKSGLKQDMEFKSDLKLKNLLKEDILSKSAVVSGLKSSQLLKTELKPFLPSLPKTISPYREPPFRQPKIPAIQIPFYLPSAKSILKKKKKKKQQIQDLLLIPDFTARSLGLKAQTVSQKKARRELKKILTGLEIRKGVKLK